MQTKIYQLLDTFSVEYLSHFTLDHKIIKSCGAFCRIYDANEQSDIGLQHYVTVRNICD